MNKPFTIYLDLVRFGAALLVYLYHSNQRFLSTDVLPWSNFGHSSVIVFFVLSGFIIAYVTETKENTWRLYMASRFSRVFSVVLPAIVVTLLADTLGRQILPTIYTQYPYDQFGLRVLASLLLMNEPWGLSVTFFSNVPFWSIGYEWWYYVAFAGLQFVHGGRRWLCFGGVFLLLGPKLLLLAPLWFLGVLLHRWKALAHMPVPMALAGLLLSVVGIWAVHHGQLQELSAQALKQVLGGHLHTQLTFSKFFLSDYVLGPLVFLNFACMRVLAPQISGLFLHIAKPAQFLAKYTFSLYLMHQPLFLFWGAVVQGQPNSPSYWLLVTALTFLSVGVVGHFTENKRAGLRDWVLGRMQPRAQVSV